MTGYHTPRAICGHLIDEPETNTERTMHQITRDILEYLDDKLDILPCWADEGFARDLQQFDGSWFTVMPIRKHVRVRIGKQHEFHEEECHEWFFMPDKYDTQPYRDTIELIACTVAAYTNDPEAADPGYEIPADRKKLTDEEKAVCVAGLRALQILMEQNNMGPVEHLMDGRNWSLEDIDVLAGFVNMDLE